MNKKLILKYVLLCLPFAFGGVLFSFGIFNIFSSLLFFGGGYIAFKNIFDYRKVKKNINSVMYEDKNDIKKDYTYKSYDSIPGLKRTRRYSRVRKRVK